MNIELSANRMCKVKRVKKGENDRGTYYLATLSFDSGNLSIFTSGEIAELLNEHIGEYLTAIFGYEQSYNYHTGNAYTSLRLIDIKLSE